MGALVQVHEVHINAAPGNIRLTGYAGE